MSVLSLAQLVIAETESAIYSRALAIATSIGLPVTSWHAGDPTRSLYHLLAKTLASAEAVVSKYIAAGFLDYATGEWLTLLAKQVYDVDRVEATYASCVCTLTNSKGGVYEFEPGDITAKNTDGKTFHSTTGGTLAGVGATLSLQFEADEPGSDSNTDAGHLNDLVTTFIGVTITNPSNAVGVDSESDDSLRSRCRAKLGALSPNGPADAYNYVATSTVARVTRAKTIGDNVNGTVTVYVADDSGTTSGADIAAIQTAITTLATPQCVTATVVSATPKTVVVDYDIWLYSTVGESETDIKTAIAEALATRFRARPIGGDIIPGEPGRIYHSLISRTIEAVYPAHAYRVRVNLPASDVTLAANEVAVLSHVQADSSVTLVNQ